MMANNKVKSKLTKNKRTRYQDLWRQIVLHKYIYLLMLPGILYFIVFRYAPMWGLVIAFKDYNPFEGIMGSPWVGLSHFKYLFTYEYFYSLLRNTLIINFMNLILYFPVPIILALMLNEIRHDVFKRVNQSIVYLPHFLSWVVVVGLTFFMLS